MSSKLSSTYHKVVTNGPGEALAEMAANCATVTHPLATSSAASRSQGKKQSPLAVMMQHNRASPPRLHPIIPLSRLFLFSPQTSSLAHIFSYITIVWHLPVQSSYSHTLVDHLHPHIKLKNSFLTCTLHSATMRNLAVWATLTLGLQAFADPAPHTPDVVEHHADHVQHELKIALRNSSEDLRHLAGILPPELFSDEVCCMPSLSLHPTYGTLIISPRRFNSSLLLMIYNESCRVSSADRDLFLSHRQRTSTPRMTTSCSRITNF